MVNNGALINTQDHQGVCRPEAAIFGGREDFAKYLGEVWLPYLKGWMKRNECTPLMTASSRGLENLLFLVFLLRKVAVC